MMYPNSRLPLLIAALVCTSAMATNPHQQPKGNDSHDATAISGSTSKSNADAYSKSSAVAGAAAVSGSVATGGDASSTNVVTATGGAGGLGGQGGEGGAANQTQSADNAGNAQSITIQGARQIASLSQGSWAAPECGSGGNAGGSGGGGAGFLGAYWTPADCKLMMIAYTWAHIGLYGEACKTLTATKTLRGAYARYDLPLPDCVTLIAALTAVQPAPEPSAPVVDPRYVTRDELPALLRDRDERILRQAVSK